MFDVNKCASAVAAAMVGTIHTGDDASRFAQRAIAEGHSTISDLIAADAVKQALAIRAEIDRVDPTINQGIYKSTAVGKSVPFEVEPLDDFNQLAEIKHDIDLSPTEKGPEVFIPLVPAPPAAEQVGITSTSTITASVSDVELDSEGLPWDGRIHSSSKAKLAKDNTWKLKRGLDVALVEQVKGELRQVMSIPKPAQNVAAPDARSTPMEMGMGPIVPSAPVQETQGLHPDSNPFSPSTVNKLVEQGNSVQIAAADTQPVGAYSDWKLADLMRGITAKKLDPVYVAEIVKQFGIPSVPALATRPEFIPAVAEALQL